MPEPPPPRITVVGLPDLLAAAAEDVDPNDVREAELIGTERRAALDWTAATIRECELALGGVDELVLDRCRVLDSRLRNPEITRLRGRDSTWRVVEVAGGRIGALELAGSTWDSVRIADARLGYVNLRDATLTDVLLTGCRIGTLDLGAATVGRASLTDCSVAELLLTRATLVGVDLRGAGIARIEAVANLAGSTISVEQLLDVAPDLAAELNIGLG